MRTVQEIALDVTGQLVYHDAPEGRPSSVTSCDVYRWDFSDDQPPESAVGAASVESDPNTTLDAAAGETESDPRLVPLTATTGCAESRSYLIASATGLREWVLIESIASGVSVTAKHPLHNEYAIGSTFQSTRMQATVDSAWVSDLSNLVGASDVGPNPMFRVRWVYVVSGTTYVADTYFNLVRYAGRHGVTPQDMDSMVPGWLDSLPTDHRNDQGRRLIDDAYREVKLDMHQVDLAASQVAESEVIDELVRYKTLELGEWAKFFRGVGDERRAAKASERYTTRSDSLIRVVNRVPVRDETGAASAVVAVGLTRR